jgi:hypothetical protein
VCEVEQWQQADRSSPPTGDMDAGARTGQLRAASLLGKQCTRRIMVVRYQGSSGQVGGYLTLLVSSTWDLGRTCANSPQLPSSLHSSCSREIVCGQRWTITDKHTLHPNTTAASLSSHDLPAATIYPPLLLRSAQMKAVARSPQAPPTAPQWGCSATHAQQHSDTCDTSSSSHCCRVRSRQQQGPSRCPGPRQCQQREQ